MLRSLLLSVVLALTQVQAQDDAAVEAPSDVEPEAGYAPDTSGEERINDYHARIVVAEDGGLTVTETITVTAAGDKIQRGIYRDFPTTYVEDFGLSRRFDLPAALHFWRTTVPFDVVEVRRDGQPEPYHSEGIERGERVYFGQEDVLLPPGRHTYVFSYRTARQLGFFADHDELYWNVTGNAWAFPIERVSATVMLPPAVPRDRVTLSGYTGYTGSKETDLTTRIDPATGALHFSTTRPLAAAEGLTIVAEFPKGYVTEPSAAERRTRFVRDNPIVLIAPIGLLLVLLYYGGAWLAVGRDPRGGTVIPLFEPPAGLDAPGVRFVSGMGYDERCFTAGLVGMAAKGWATIEEEDGEFSLVAAGSKSVPLGPAELALKKALLAGGRIEFKQKNHGTIRAAIKKLKEALVREHEGTLFRSNRRWVIPGVVLSALLILAVGFSGPLASSFAFGFMLVWLTGWTFACLRLLLTAAFSWREIARPGVGVLRRIGALIGALVITAFALPFFLGEIFGLMLLTQVTGLLMVPVLITLAVASGLFYRLLRQPTESGRRVMDEIEGFKMYLTTAEGAELAQAEPARTTERYERLLPYAIAFGVENEWAEKFSDVLAAAQADGEPGYKPQWFHGSSYNSFGSTQFGSVLSSSLASSVASSSSPPGRSSGGGGGGSSGGGGGGGGGGGW